MKFFKKEFFLSTPGVLAQSYYPSLNGLRGVSIIMVVIGHVFFNSKNFFIDLFSGGFGVLIFFVISGFLITSLLLKEKIETGSVSLKKFYIRRFLRIVPVSFLYLGVLAILNYIYHMRIPADAFLSSILYIRNTSIFPTADWYTAHYWSLSVEEQFYLVFPFLLVKNIRVYVITLLVMIVVIPVFNYATVHHLLLKSLFLLNQLIKNLTGILVGSLFSLMLFSGLITSAVMKNRWIVSLMLFLASALINSQYIGVIPSSISPTIASILIAILIVINLTPGDDFVFRMLNNSYLGYIGILSYSIYIWQQLFTHTMPWSNAFEGADNSIFNLLLLFGVSYLSYHFYEKKFLLLKNKFKNV